MILTNNDARLNSGRRTDPLERARRPDQFIESYRRCHSRLVAIFHRSAKGVLYTGGQSGVGKHSTGVKHRFVLSPLFSSPIPFSLSRSSPSPSLPFSFFHQLPFFFLFFLSFLFFLFFYSPPSDISLPFHGFRDGGFLEGSSLPRKRGASGW